MKVKPILGPNPKAGQIPEFKYDPFPKDFTVVVDTREQDPLFLSKRPLKGLLIIRDKLSVGDYSIRGFEEQIAISRKTIVDLYSSLFSNWERELTQLQRLSTYEWKCLVIEGSESDVLKWQYYSKVHPNSMKGRICSIEIRLGIHFHYEPDRKKLERWVLDRLLKFYRMKRE